MQWKRRYKYVILMLAVVGFAVTRSVMAGDWRTASREPTGIAPDPAVVKEAVVQVYAARAWGWRGAFGVHSWIAVKPEDAVEYTVYEVIGWRVLHGSPALNVSNRPPDSRWFGSEPEVVSELRGKKAGALIERIDAAARAYPFNDTYRIWPGPNSNTFTAFVARAVPELKVDLPPTAIGKDYLSESFFAPTPSGTGYQVSVFGLFGVLAGVEEGLEVNILGLTFGIDPKGMALKLPLAGRIGLGAS